MFAITLRVSRHAMVEQYSDAMRAEEDEEALSSEDGAAVSCSFVITLDTTFTPCYRGQDRKREEAELKGALAINFLLMSGRHLSSLVCSTNHLDAVSCRNVELNFGQRCTCFRFRQEGERVVDEEGGRMVSGSGLPPPPSWRAMND